MSKNKIFSKFYNKSKGGQRFSIKFVLICIKVQCGEIVKFQENYFWSYY